MNKIKFRVYDKEDEYYLSDSNLEDLVMDMHGRLSYFETNPYGEGNEVDYPDLVVEQFINLKDKNITDIYDGDVCHIKTEKDVAGLDFLQWDTKIIISRNCNKFVALDFDTKEEKGYLDMSFIESVIEVIGNIHEK